MDGQDDEHGTRERLKQIEALLQSVMQHQSEEASAREAWKRDILHALGKTGDGDGLAQQSDSSRARVAHPQPSPSPPADSAAEEERSEDGGFGDSFGKASNRKAAERALAVKQMPRDARVAELQAIEGARLRRLSEDYGKPPSPTVSPALPPAPCAQRRPSLGTVIKLRRGSTTAPRFGARKRSEEKTPEAKDFTTQRRPSYFDAIASGSKPLEEAYRLFEVDSSEAESRESRDAVGERRGSGLAPGDSVGERRGSGLAPGDRAEGASQSLRPPQGRVRRESREVTHLSAPSIAFLPRRSSYDARRLSGASATSFQSCVHAMPHLSSHHSSSPSMSPFHAAGQHARKTMEELHAFGNAIGSGAPEVVGREEELRSLLRWDTEVGALLDEMKKEQLKQMQADERGKCRRSSLNVPRRLSMVGAARTRSEESYSHLTDTSDLTRPRRFILTADGRGRHAIDWLATCFIWYTVVSVPVCALVLPGWRGWWALNGVCDGVFVLHAIANCLTSFEDNLLGIEVFAPRAIIKRYLRNFVVLDLLPVVPLDYALRGQLVGPAAAPLDLGNLCRFVRLLKMAAWTRRHHTAMLAADATAARAISDVLNPSVLTLLSLLLSLLFLWHYVACIYYYLSDVDDLGGVHGQDSSALFRGGAFSPPPLLAGRGLIVRYVRLRARAQPLLPITPSHYYTPPFLAPMRTRPPARHAHARPLSLYRAHRPLLLARPSRAMTLSRRRPPCAWRSGAPPPPRRCMPTTGQSLSRHRSPTRCRTRCLSSSSRSSSQPAVCLCFLSSSVRRPL